MAILSYDQCQQLLLSGLVDRDIRNRFDLHAARLLPGAHHRGLFYRKSQGLPIIYPRPEYKYAANFLHMMFSIPPGCRTNPKPSGRWI